MNTLLPVRIIFGVAAIYETVLGLAFIVAGPAIFTAAGIEPPNHWGYLHFPAGLLVIFGYMFLQIARDPLANRGFVPYGILLKVCYVATVGWHWYSGGVPPMWKYLAAADLALALLFFWSLIPISMLVEESAKKAALPHAA